MADDSTTGAAVPVLVPMPAPGPYSYGVPAGMAPVPGAIVAVPLGPRLVPGVAHSVGTVAISAESGSGPAVRICASRPATKTPSSKP